MEPRFSNLFPNADKMAWLTQVQQELKGEVAYERLRWQTGEGFTLEPYYTADSLDDVPLDLIQAAQKPTAGWLNAPGYYITDEKDDNTALREAIMQGADALVLNLPTADVNLSHLLNGIKLSDTPVFFRLRSDASLQSDFIRTLKIMAPYQLKGGLLTDVSDATTEITRLTADSPLFRTVCVGSHAFHNAGATATQELAFTLASLADAYDTLTDNGLTIDQLVPKTMLSLSVGTSYFLEIAKLRTLRVLYNRFISHYSLSSSHYPAFIHCQTSTFYDAAVTPYTNLLRATTEAMAAVLGGCDALTVHPYDLVLEKSASPTLVPQPDEDFADRIARNVSLLLNEESYLNKVADPSAGSYYLENLTHQLSEAAWALFLTVEKQGGFAKAVANDFIPTEIERAYRAKVEAVQQGNVLVGVTKFRSDESFNQTGQVSKEATGLLPDRRLAEKFE